MRVTVIKMRMNESDNKHLGVFTVKKGQILQMFSRDKGHKCIKERSERTITQKQQACCLGIMIVPNADALIALIICVTGRGEPVKDSPLQGNCIASNPLMLYCL